MKSRRGLRRLLAWSGFAVAALLASLLTALVVTGCASMGSAPEGERLARARQSPQWQGDQFVNPQPMWSDLRSAWLQLLFGQAPPDVEPQAAVPVVRATAATFATLPATGLRVTWFGHASALVEIDGARVLIDPFWSERASPVQWAGPRRWFAPPLALSELPPIDAVLISHDHYDHLDHGAVLAMASWRTVFVVPLGVGAHLAGWGIPANRIVELDWWQSARIAGLEVVATPARHASGRKGTKSGQTLWAGYAMLGPQHRAWYSGDTGLHDELPTIGERLGPFDVTLIEAGQYDANWPDTHLGPEQAVEAHRLVRGKAMLPVHWALLRLGNHGWTEPVERVLAAAKCKGVEVLLPRPGESVEPDRHTPATRWWPDVPWHTAAESPVVATRRGLPAERVAGMACP